MGIFTLEPRRPLTLASAARFIAGRPPGQAELDREPLLAADTVAARWKPLGTWVSVPMRASA
jgi:hypothetical protein